MKYKLLLLAMIVVTATTGFRKPAPTVTIYFIRHGEKPAKGDNLDCRGENRALQLPAVIKKKIGIPISRLYLRWAMVNQPRNRACFKPLPQRLLNMV